MRSVSVMEWGQAVTRTVAVLACAGLALAAQDGGNKSAPSVSLCEVLTHPAEYSGKNVMLSVRITATKEGASLWDPGCSRVGVSLVTDPEVRSKPGIAELYRVLRLHGLSDHPVIARLSGVFLENQNSAVRHRRRPVFKAVAASDIRQSQAVEHR